MNILGILGILCGLNRIFILYVICESELLINGKKFIYKINFRYNVLERCVNI